MADIFLSYSREDRAAIEPLAEQIAAAGYSVWWDKQLSGGKRYLEETEGELNAAKIVLVVWSKKSVTSHWVADEAGAGRDTGRLLPVSMDGSMPPLGFRQFQVIDLSKWPGDEAGFRDLLSALARLSAPSSEPQLQPTQKPAAGPFGLPRSPLVLGGAALALVAILAFVLMNVMGPKAPAAAALKNDRTAFFGFIPDAGGLSTEVAAAATEETRTALNNLGLETAAPGDTQGVKMDEQLARAGKLNARYALAGNVLASGDKLNVTIRLDDTQLRATLWQATLTGEAAQRESLPVQAAAKASYLLQCLITVRPDMAREDAAALGLVTRACEPASGFDPRGFTAWREAVRVAPKSAYAEYMTSSSWIFQAGTASAAERPAMLEQARAASLRARALDPASPMARAGLATVDIASDRPLAELLEELNAALAVGAETSTLRSVATTSAYRVALLTTVGRYGEAARLGRVDAAADPLNLTLQAAYASALAGAGQVLESRRVLDTVNRRMADPANWARYAGFVISSPGGDFSTVLKSMPPGVSPETAACLQEAARAAPLHDAAIRKAAARRIAACLRAGATQPGMSISLISYLGDVDTAFDVVDRALDRSNPLAFVQAGSGLFSSQSAPLRADPRFLPLVKKVGIYQYWLDTKTQPDVCETPEEREIEVCRELRKDQGK